MSDRGRSHAMAMRKHKIILTDGADTSDRQDETSQTEKVNVLDWKGRFGRRSPLSRKIITFNLVALGVLLTGVLYLNQSDGALEELRLRGMMTEAKLVSNILAQELEPGSLENDPAPAMTALSTLQRSTESRMFLFDPGARLVGMFTPNGGATPASEIIRIEPDRPTAFTAIMTDIWDRISRIFHKRRIRAFPLGVVAAEPLAGQVLETSGVVQDSGSTGNGDQVLSVGVPIVKDGDIIGALVLITRPGDLDVIIRSDRERILQVFALASIISIILSLVLANTIVGPLRDLALAAQEGASPDSGKLNPERINMPDMTARPDEIGYLSGAMRQMTKALFDRIEANESFAADVAHEIKNPLTSLRSAVETMPYAKKDDDRQRLLDVIKNDVDRLDRLVTDISNASRLDSELVRDQMEMFDLHLLLRNILQFTSDPAERKGATLVEAFGRAPLEILGLEGRLAQVFTNLVTNAISFASEGDRIRVHTRATDNHTVRITVEDDGPGIPDDNLADVFKRFYSERPSAEEFGNHSGLGLAISRQIVEAHSGTIHAENIRPYGADLSTPPLGARFVVELPV
ncbi:MAG: ATP-binding protein [Pseudomonadota bacterium]